MGDRIWVFTYGTLKKGFQNHVRVMQRPGTEGFYELKGRATTVGAWPMFLDHYAIPYIANRAGLGQPIAGEVYEVTPEGLVDLDALEGYPDRYTRQLVDVQFNEPGDSLGGTHQAWMYMIIHDVPRLESREFFSDYPMELHAAKFVPPGEQRDASLKQPWGGFELPG